MTPRQLSRHLRTDRYGNFRLSAAIRPAPEQFVVPVEGYRREIYRGPDARGADATPLAIPTIAAAVSAERLFDTFLALLEPLEAGAEKQERWSHVIEIKVLQALAHSMRGEEPEAFTLLAQAHDILIRVLIELELVERRLHDGVVGVGLGLGFRL